MSTNTAIAIVIIYAATNTIDSPASDNGNSHLNAAIEVAVNIAMATTLTAAFAIAFAAAIATTLAAAATVVIVAAIPAATTAPTTTTDAAAANATATTPLHLPPLSILLHPPSTSLLL
jgi:hypothetical protein